MADSLFTNYVSIQYASSINWMKYN